MICETYSAAAMSRHCAPACQCPARSITVAEAVPVNTVSRKRTIESEAETPRLVPAALSTRRRQDRQAAQPEARLPGATSPTIRPNVE